jgi:putative ABC transport system substrate-binding protein
MKKIVSIILAVLMLTALVSCKAEEKGDNSFTVGICNYVDDASLNQIVDNIKTRLTELGAANDVTFNILYDNCNSDANVMSQIIANFIANDVDLMVGVATPVAMNMQSATETNKIPVVFAAVSDPLAAGLVDTLEAPGSNITGTSDFLDTTAVMNLIFATKPDADKIGLLYDIGQDSSTTAINDAKKYLTDKGVEFVERTGTNVDEIKLAANALVADGVDAIFTPSDNTVMNAQLSIYEDLTAAGIPQFTGADSFALNGAFLGYGVDYANLGRETADMIYDLLVNKNDPAKTAVKTFDNGTATINTETCAALGFDFDVLSKALAPYCTNIEEITTANSFDDLK